MVSYGHIKKYRRAMEELRSHGGPGGELTIRRAFANLLDAYCREHDLLLVDEERHGSVQPDGTIKNRLQIPCGYWEAKDTGTGIDRAIQDKFKKDYPKENILFENSEFAVLIQNGAEVNRVDMADDAELEKIILQLVRYRRPVITRFERAVKQFKSDLPMVLDSLREMIERESRNNADFRNNAEEFLRHCRETINPEVGDADVREMLIQHILTEEIFTRIFQESQFHRENNVARKLYELEATFFHGDAKRDLLFHLQPYYATISGAAAEIHSHRDKQSFLKAIYEDFYKAYNPKAADRLGVVYTPDEIVDFMIRAANDLVKKHFGYELSDDNVYILDPAAGTGTFIVEMLNTFPKQTLRRNYDELIYVNEVGILPYYIANLNIEHTYWNRTREYREFPNLCFVDTLDNLAFTGQKGQLDSIAGLSAENLERIKRQNEKRISVIIGNPPYNANQRSENDNNKNREYPGVDARIKQTYIAASTAQKTKQYDMYKRFIRWASDRLNENGVLAFITNRAYLDSRQDDGFRKVAAEEFSNIYVVDLGGDIRSTPGAGNVFGIMTGVAIGFFVRNKAAKKPCKIRYAKLDDYKTKEDKLAFLATHSLEVVGLGPVVPDKKHHWLRQTDNNFDELLLLADRKTKLACNGSVEESVFKLFSLGVSTNRDDWVHDFDRKILAKKIRHFVRIYEETRKKLAKKKDNGLVFEDLDTSIKWTPDLRRQLKKKSAIRYNGKHIRVSMYRPYTKKFVYFHKSLNERPCQQPSIFPTGKESENKVICVSQSQRTLFQVLACSAVPSLALFVEPAQCLPLYRYDKNGERGSNITAWGLARFRDHYKNRKISAEDIFHYTYAVLHHPAYREKYQINLTREFPRLPFYKNFSRWVKWGKQLMDLHLNFEDAKPWPLKRTDLARPAGRAGLKADKNRNTIVIDEKTTLAEIPPRAWEYKLGKRSALEWVLDQYREKSPRDPTVRRRFNAYQFSGHKEKVIGLLCKLTTVSVETVKVTAKMKE